MIGVSHTNIKVSQHNQDKLEIQVLNDQRTSHTLLKFCHWVINVKGYRFVCLYIYTYIYKYKIYNIYIIYIIIIIQLCEDLLTYNYLVLDYKPLKICFGQPTAVLCVVTQDIKFLLYICIHIYIYIYIYI